MDIRELPIDEVVLDPSLNLRDRLDDFTVERYADAWNRLPPVTVYEVDGQWLLADGFHRHAAAVMIGRGAQGQPWRVGQIAAGLAEQAPVPAPVGDELVEIVIEHYEGVLSEYGVEVGVRAARKHLDWYLEASGIAIDRETRRGLVEGQDPAEVIASIRSIFASELREAA